MGPFFKQPLALPAPLRTIALALLAAATPALSQSTIGSVSPNTAYTPCAPFSIVLTGTDFLPSSDVRLGSEYLTTVYVSSTEISATVTSGVLGVPGPTTVVVENAEQPDSNAVAFTIGRTPVSGVTPSSVNQGASDTVITVSGDCFTVDATVLWNGTSLTTSYIDATTLEATIPAASLASSGLATITVANGNGNISAGQDFYINEHTGPTISGVSPSESYPPCAPFDITVTGSGFEPDSVVTLGGSPLATTFVNSGQLTATVSSAALASPGASSIVVETPSLPDSNAFPFVIGATPFTSILPSSATAGSGTTLITVTGSCFVSGATVRWNGVNLATTFLNASALQAQIPAANLVSATTATLTVRNANGNTSAGLPFEVTEPLVPLIESVSPTASYPPCAPFDITVTGQNLPFNGQVELGGVALVTSPGNGSQLIATVTAAALANPGATQIVVTSASQPDSNAFPFTIGATPFTAMTPSSASAGSSATVITVTGSCFVAGATVRWNGSALATTFVNATTLTATIPAGNLLSQGTASVTVENANGNTSAARTFTITDPAAPSIDSVTPSASYPPCAPFDITVTGQDFTAASTVRLGGTLLTTSFVNAGQLTATVSSAALVSPGPSTVTVETTGLPDSNAFPFTIGATPFTAMTPSSASAGSSATVITVTGSCFVAGATVRWNGSALATTFVNATTLTATIPAGNLLSQGTASVTVENANGNTSAARTFTITDPAAPSIDSVTPSASYPPCAPFDITVTGQDFTAASTVRLGGTLLTTSFVNAGQLTATVSSAALVSPGPSTVTVETTGLPDSNAFPFTIGATPFTAMTPSSASAGSSATVITVTGSCFVAGATVRWNGSALATTFVNATTLTATIPAGNLLSQGTASVTVENANGNTSAARTFTITDPAAPSIDSVTPSASYPPCAPFDITVTGQNLPPGGQVSLGGAPLATLPGNAGQLIATVTSAALATPGVAQVVVTTSSQVASNSLPFTIRATPFTGMQPGAAIVGSGALTLSIQGDCFEQGAVVLWNGAPLATSFNGPTSLSATVPEGNLTAPGVASITVRNANGNPSAPMSLPINDPVGPGGLYITSLTPAEVVAGLSASIDIAGAMFDPAALALLRDLPASTVQWLSSTLLRVSAPASELALSGVIPVTVENPDGSRSSSIDLRVAPVITALNPPVWSVGRACELLVVGRGFRPESTLLLEGLAATVRLTPSAPPSLTQMLVCLPPQQVARPGTVRVRVCTGSGAQEVCSRPYALDIVEEAPELLITDLRPSSAVAGSGEACLAVDVEATGADPEDVVILWDGVELAPFDGECQAATALRTEPPGSAQGTLRRTVTALAPAALLARERPRDPALACAADPLAVKITAFAPTSQTVSAPVCFDIRSLVPTIGPPTITTLPDGCLAITIPGENLHADAEIVVDGLEADYCTDGEPRVSGCSLDAAGSAICTQITLTIPPLSAPSGQVSVTIRNPGKSARRAPPKRRSCRSRSSCNPRI